MPVRVMVRSQAEAWVPNAAELIAGGEDRLAGVRLDEVAEGSRGDRAAFELGEHGSGGPERGDVR